MTGVKIVEHILLGLISLSGGLVISFGLVALIIGLNLIPRFAGVTKTAYHIRLYEKCVMAGAVFGNLLTIYEIRLPAWGAFANGIGLFGGIYLGSWIVALTEVIDMFPVLAKKSSIKVGIAVIILSIAIGKSLFSLIYYYKGW